MYTRVWLFGLFQHGLTCARGRIICLGFWVESTADVAPCSPAAAVPLLVLFLMPSNVFLMKLLRLDEVVGLLLLLLLLDATTDGVDVELADGDKLLRLTTVPAGRGAAVMMVDTIKNIMNSEPRLKSEDLGGSLLPLIQCPVQHYHETAPLIQLIYFEIMNQEQSR